LGLEFTQLSFASEVKEWINEIIKNEGLKFECADIEIKEKHLKRGDVIIWERRLDKPALLIEIWDASTPPWEEAWDSAASKALRMGIPHFVVWNIRHFFCWDTSVQGDAIDKLWWPHAGVSESVCEAVTYRDAILKFKDAIKSYLRIFLKEFEGVYFGYVAKPLLGIDERFIYRLRGTIHALSIPVIEELKNRADADIGFKKELIKYFREQGWSFKNSDEDFDKVARQYVYLLVNKILFYNILRHTPNFSSLISKIDIPEVGINGAKLKERLNSYFNRAFEATGNYETVLLTNFLDSITPPDSIVKQVRDFINKLSGYDFSKINYEILGNIFQRLIPAGERHKLGQYYTRSDVVDLIVGFCVRSADDKVLDGGCGAGTFLVRSYVRKKILNPNKSHRELIEDIYGVDIAKFPAHLSVINLVSKGLSEIENYPNILHKDFFDVLPGEVYTSAEVKATRLNRMEKVIKLPKLFDAVVMNPPYTRQEEMEDILEEEKNKAYKRCIEDWKAMSNYPKRKELKLSKRASIYVHFFIHGGRFLKESGRLGLITSNSWLDVDYGGDLQRFFLENFKIKAVIESKVERWFEDADINTAITILERCSNLEERGKNVVRFVQLKRPLAEFIPPVENERERWAYVEKLIDLIESKDGYYEDEKIRVFTKMQKKLWEEGYDEEKNEYVGSKWGKYIKAPKIFYTILNKSFKFEPLKTVLKGVRYGLKTGAEDFFYFNDEKIKKYCIKLKFFKPIATSPQSLPTIVIRREHVNEKLLYITLDKEILKVRDNALFNYLKLGKRWGIPNRPSLKGREPWYYFGEITPWNLAIPRLVNDRFIVFYNPFDIIIDDSFTELYVDDTLVEIIAAILNSTLAWLFLEINGSTGLGQGALFLSTKIIKTLEFLNLKEIPREYFSKIEETFKELSIRPIGSVFEEIGAYSPDEVSLDKVKPDRRRLDKIILGDILGLTEEEQLEVYRAVIDLVKSRIERAKSVQKRKKVGELDIEELVNSVLKDVERLHGVEAKKFPEDYIGEVPYRVITVPKGDEIQAGVDLEGPYVQIDDEKIRCNSVYEARFIQYALLAGKTSIPLPEDENVLRKAVQEREKLLIDAKKIVEGFLNEAIADKKLKEKVSFEVFRKLGIQ
jgi:type I restriction-modification system DNA methylase subunit